MSNFFKMVNIWQPGFSGGADSKIESTPFLRLNCLQSVRSLFGQELLLLWFDLLDPGRSPESCNFLLPQAYSHLLAQIAYSRLSQRLRRLPISTSLEEHRSPEILEVKIRHEQKRMAEVRILPFVPASYTIRIVCRPKIIPEITCVGGSASNSGEFGVAVSIGRIHSLTEQPHACAVRIAQFAPRSISTVARR